MHYWCRGREGCLCSRYPKRIYSYACIRLNWHGVYQDPWIPGVYNGGNSPRCVQVARHNRKRVWNSCWYTAIFRCMTQWLQPFYITVSLQRFWKTFCLRLTRNIRGSLTIWLTGNIWLSVITWMIVSWATEGEKSMIGWSIGLDRNMKASSKTDQGRWR